jgi:hypothetical protein
MFGIIKETLHNKIHKAYTCSLKKDYKYQNDLLMQAQVSFEITVIKRTIKQSMLTVVVSCLMIDLNRILNKEAETKYLMKNMSQ